MRPRKRDEKGSGDLFRARLDQIVNMKHELVRLADEIDWDWIDAQVADRFAAEGRPGTDTRFMIGILLLKQTCGLSDEGVWERRVHDPYFQHFTGETLFQHEARHERSGLSHWRGRLGDKLELLLAESLRSAPATGALKAKDLKRVTADTTVQPKNIAHPTDAKLMHKAIVMLGKEAREHGVKLRRPYDGHTLGTVIAETEALTGVEIERAYVDKGYVGHNAPKPLRVYRSGRKRGVHGQIKKELRRRAAIEPVIGHLKSEGHLERNYLKGRHGDQANAVLTATGHNPRLALGWLRKLLCKFIAPLIAAITPISALRTAS